MNQRVLQILLIAVIVINLISIGISLYQKGFRSGQENVLQVVCSQVGEKLSTGSTVKCEAS